MLAGVHGSIILAPVLCRVDLSLITSGKTKGEKRAVFSTQQFNSRIRKLPCLQRCNIFHEYTSLLLAQVLCSDVKALIPGHFPINDLTQLLLSNSIETCSNVFHQITLKLRHELSFKN